MADEKNEGMSDNVKIGIAAGIAFLLLGILAFLAMRKPAPKVYTPGAKTPTTDTAHGIVDAVTTTVQSIALNKTKLLNAGSSGAEVSALQDDLGQLGNAITVDGNWGPDTTAAFNAQTKAWLGFTQALPVTLAWWQATSAGKFPSDQAAAAAQQQAADAELNQSPLAV